MPKCKKMLVKNIAQARLRRDCFIIQLKFENGMVKHR